MPAPLLLLLLLTAACAAPQPTRSPNVVLVMVDDLGFQDLGCYGHPAIRTPALDDLAARGVRLTDFHAGATVCTPSRMALLSGCYPPRVGWTTGVIGYGMEGSEGLHPAAPTLAERFRAAGYATGLFGKWHLGEAPGVRPLDRGFDEVLCTLRSNNQVTELWRGEEVVEDPFVNRLLTERFKDAALAFVDAHADEPFLLYVPLTAPHFPVEAHPDWEGRSEFGAYGDVVEELDAAVGELVQALEARELLEDTIVIFCSDNGPQPGQPAGSAPFRGEKWSALEGGTGVPALVSWPGRLPAGVTCDALVSAMDLAPTLYRACGVPGPELRLDGVDVWDTLRGEDDAHPREDLLLWHGQDPAPQAIRVGSWKLFLDAQDALVGPGTRRRTPEQAAELAALAEREGPVLFDLAVDPDETVDVGAKHPERVAAMHARATRLFAEVEASRVGR